MRTRPLSWPDLDGLTAKQVKTELGHYSASSEVKPLASNFERAGLSVVSMSAANSAMELEALIDDRCDSSGKTALRADDIRLLVNDRPRAPVDADKWPAGGSHSRPMRTQIVRSLTSEDDLLDELDSIHAASVMVACDSLASPNQAPRRREILHSAGATVQRHVISQPVQGELLPARQVVNASEASYDTIEVYRLADTYTADNGVTHSRPVTLACLLLNFGVDNETEVDNFYVRQRQACERAMAMFEALERIEQAVTAIQAVVDQPLPPAANYWQSRHIQLSAKWPYGAMRQQAVKTRCGGIVPVVR